MSDRDLSLACIDVSKESLFHQIKEGGTKPRHKFVVISNAVEDVVCVLNASKFKVYVSSTFAIDCL